MQRLFVASWVFTRAPLIGIAGGCVGAFVGGVLYAEDYPPKQAFPLILVGMTQGGIIGGVTGMVLAVTWPIVAMTSSAYFIARSSKPTTKPD